MEEQLMSAQLCNLQYWNNHSKKE